MRVLMGWLCACLTVAPVAAFPQDQADTLLRATQQQLADSRVAKAPATPGRRSPQGPQLYRRVVDSVVLIVTEEAMGSGVVVSSKGYVLTNWHVVEGQEVVGVIPRTPALLRGLGQLRKEDITLARVIAVDQRRDLALLFIITTIPVGLRSVPLGESGGLEVGQDVYAIGHPRKLLWSYTEGIVSQIRPDYQWSYEDGSEHQATVIQTQTPMHPGSSGGALFDANGRVVGINAAILDPTLGFAIAVSEVRDWVQNLSRR